MSFDRNNYLKLVQGFESSVDYYSEQYHRTGDVNARVLMEHNARQLLTLKEWILEQERKNNA